MKTRSPFWQLNYRHKRFVEALIKHNHHVESAAREVKLSRQRAYELVKDPRIIAGLEERLKSLRSSLRMGLEEAMERMTDLARDKQHKDHFQALKTVLQVHGALGTQTVDINVSVPELKKQIQEVARRLLEGGADVVDAQLVKALPGRRPLLQEAVPQTQEQAHSDPPTKEDPDTSPPSPDLPTIP